MSEATIQFQGRLTNEPQQRQAGNYTVTNIDVAVDGSRKDQQGGNQPQGPAPQYNRQPNQAPQQLNQQQNQPVNQVPQYSQQTGNGFNQQAGQVPAPQNAPQGNNMGNYPNQPQNGSQGLGTPGGPQSVNPNDLPF